MNKINRIKLLAFIIVLGMALLACATFGNGSTGDSEVGDVDAGILFSDDFSSSSSGWDRADGETGSSDYENDAYVIEVKKDKHFIWANPYLDFTDVRVEVDAVLVDGEFDNSFGLICRHADIDNFYALLVSSDGYYAIRKRINGSEMVIISGDGSSYLYDERILQGYETNRIAAECVGSSLRLYVNGDLLAEVVDSDIASGDVGLVATTFSATYTKISFDNFIVLVP